MHQQRGVVRHSLPALAEPSDADWAGILAARQGAGTPPGPLSQTPWGPLIDPKGHGGLVIGQLGQSLDGRIATPSGHSHYINGPAALTHLHRLRALVDAVVVGVGTVVADDPQLTVRRVPGPQPVRVVVDPHGRIPRTARLLQPPGRTVVVVRRGIAPLALPGVETRPVEPAGDGSLPPPAIVEVLLQLGLRRLLIEGGAATLSRFLAAGCLQRLHLLMAPLIIGSGPIGLSLPPIERLDEAWRGRMQAWHLGDDLLLDLDLAPAGQIGPFLQGR